MEFDGVYRVAESGLMCWVPWIRLPGCGRAQDEVGSLKPGEVRERTPACLHARTLALGTINHGVSMEARF